MHSKSTTTYSVIYAPRVQSFLKIRTTILIIDEFYGILKDAVVVISERQNIYLVVIFQHFNQFLVQG